MRKNINKVTMNFLKRNKFENDVENVLSLKDKSVLIYMILSGIPFPMIIAEERGDSHFVLSGWNAISTVQQFMRGEFSIEGIDMMEELLTESIVGKTFFDFSDDLKDEFLDTEMVISVFRHPLTGGERETVLNVLNKAHVYNGIHLPSFDAQIVFPAIKEESVEKAKTNGKPQSIDEQLESMLKHPFFEKVNISPLTNDIAISLFMVSENGAISDLSGAKIAEFKTNLSEVPSYKPVVEFLNQAYTEKTAYLKKAHLPMVYVCAQKALESKVTAVRFKTIIDDFFASNNPAYKKAGDNGTASKSNVNTRIRLMLEYFNSKA